MYLNVWYLAGRTAKERLVGVALEDVCQWDWVHAIPVFSLSAYGCGSDINLLQSCPTNSNCLPLAPASRHTLSQMFSYLVDPNHTHTSCQAYKKRLLGKTGTSVANVQRRKAEYFLHVHSNSPPISILFQQKEDAYEISVLLFFLLILLSVTSLAPSTCIIHLVIILPLLHLK